VKHFSLSIRKYRTLPLAPLAILGSPERGDVKGSRLAQGDFPARGMARGPGGAPVARFMALRSYPQLSFANAPPRV